MHSARNIDKIIYLLLTLLLIVTSCDLLSSEDNKSDDNLNVSGIINTTLKYIEYDYDSHDTELEATNRSIMDDRLPLYAYELYFNYTEIDTHQQFVSFTSNEGFKYYCPLNVDFSYDGVNKRFTNIYAVFSEYDTVAQRPDSSKLIIIEGLISD